MTNAGILAEKTALCTVMSGCHAFLVTIFFVAKHGNRMSGVAVVVSVHRRPIGSAHGSAVSLWASWLIGVVLEVLVE